MKSVFILFASFCYLSAYCQSDDQLRLLTPPAQQNIYQLHNRLWDEPVLIAEPEPKLKFSDYSLSLIYEWKYKTINTHLLRNEKELLVQPVYLIKPR